MIGSQQITFVLIHSPFVGPFTWSRVADKLRRGYETVVPPLPRVKNRPPYWAQDAGAVAEAIKRLSPDRAIILVGHSGAGALLPAIRQLAGRAVAGYIFADAGIPIDGKSRLELLDMEWPGVGTAVGKSLHEGGRFPQWGDEELRETIKDARTRRGIMAEFNPQGQDFFTEPIPVFAGWPDAPAAYLQFSPGYNYPAAQAQAAGWSFLNLHADHFYLLVNPQMVADAILELTQSVIG